MKKEEPLIWTRDTGEDYLPPKEPADPSSVEKAIRDFKRAKKGQRGTIIIGLVVMWLLGGIGCYLAGLVLHETAHLF